METCLTAIRRSSFDLAHRLSKDGALAAKGFETRVWSVRDKTRPTGLRPQPIPPEVVAKLGAS
jgi:4-hydroxybenzoyl-CoA thioesterase